ncbi:MAG: hypothetical protein A2504_04000 [Bdellovibrionales bacterium RIFOXYD12_FULL_39_22]|nr:MAG: hypothetical protein A2385_11750 [Bdellovibrionales bacterium RIFOXYB1_FULL_39_21]OFZ41738.1 MAG: hypothetical protein A2485_02060 [Bdellovibrionales bacterium RIFOXYC12_FULL_39_17]OFZ46138.1 MAG: hypothetical protein A2404_12425 [Bdellovibrionales bacterium RIFOXYC1_FULL_39_130]OFZ69089.1 MAG: hypothetical protein A2451_12110 [Bdellovibrionales bacterium RIFOXYC2_FULL_39_8]OFZ74964.1 MAG: hypothetical protein A2560_15465 [Bdellovibrionales bacterium RIFOXYD1_FULL_39_84]OFZ92817.1 MAG:
MATNEEFEYFQFAKELEIPVYVKFIKNSFSPNLATFLGKNKFTQLDAGEIAKLIKSIGLVRNMRILSMVLPTPTIAREIDRRGEDDLWGAESIVPRPGHKIYRYKKFGVMVYSFMSCEWQLAAFEDFGGPENDGVYKVIINRFLSWALAPLGVVGFWGVPVDEGVVIMRQNKSKGEAVYFDFFKNNIISLDGNKKLSARFKIMRLNSTLHGRNVAMSAEELLSFLTTHTSYFDYNGPSVPVRQIIQALSKSVQGLLHPEESFRPRTDLSL